MTGEYMRGYQDGTTVAKGVAESLLAQASSEKATLMRRIDELCAKIEQGKAENAKLVDVLHEVEQEAIYAYNCLQQDCEAMVDGQTHFFNKWWHAECECDRAKSQNAKLTNLAKWMYQVMDMSCAVRYPHEPAPVSIQALNRAEKELQALGIEVPS